ncbi:hypothetical protein M231_00195 [Tremella mesenterica]|uniref:Uncharacterized protein n=2 Tax=Tremella mesenterica TaxID=5217 RepID=A0A4Q1BWT1_TREME|nr:hypothetical protein M231_00195 [Tremella mesenterica]
MPSTSDLKTVVVHTSTWPSFSTSTYMRNFRYHVDLKEEEFTCYVLTNERILVRMTYEYSWPTNMLARWELESSEDELDAGDSYQRTMIDCYDPPIPSASAIVRWAYLHELTEHECKIGATVTLPIDKKTFVRVLEKERTNLQCMFGETFGEFAFAQGLDINRMSEHLGDFVQTNKTSLFPLVYVEKEDESEDIKHECDESEDIKQEEDEREDVDWETLQVEDMKVEEDEKEDWGGVDYDWTEITHEDMKKEDDDF